MSKVLLLETVVFYVVWQTDAFPAQENILLGLGHSGGILGGWQYKTKRIRNVPSFALDRAEYDICIGCHFVLILVCFCDKESLT